MSDTPFDRPLTQSAPTLSEALIYRALFAVLFVFSAFALMLARMAGRESSTSVWQGAKQAAHATAGYAVKY